MATAKGQAIKGLWPELPQGSNAKFVVAGAAAVAADSEADEGEAPNNNMTAANLLLTSRKSQRFVTE